MRILITGHRGFVGRHFTKRLQIEGHTVIGIDKQDGNWVQDFFSYTNGNSTTRYDLVIHLAAMVGGRAKIDGDPLAVAENLAIDSDMFRWAIRTQQPRVVYFSSSAAYPTAFQSRERQWKLKEKDLWLGPETTGIPDQTYGWAKLTGEMLARHAEAAGTRVHIFRPFSGYGEDQDLDYPFPSFIDRAKRREDPFEIWGDGEQTRDFIHIDDIVEAVLEAVKQDIPGPVNLGWGRATSFNQLAGMVADAAGYSPEIKHLKDKPVGCFYRVSDSSKMMDFYTPRITLEEGIERALRS